MLPAYYQYCILAGEKGVKLDKNSTLAGALYGSEIDIKKDNTIVYELAIEALVVALGQ